MMFQDYIFDAVISTDRVKYFRTMLKADEKTYTVARFPSQIIAINPSF